MTTDVTDNTAARTKLWEMIKDIRFAMFTTQHGNGHLHSRPMTTQNSNLDESSNLWFFMSRKSEPVADFIERPSVCAVYADPESDSYVSVSGTAVIVEDMAKKEQLWSKLVEAWFPGGVTDPDVALVRVEIAHANYWDVKESKVVQLYKMAKAAVTGKPPEGMGEQAEIRMK